MERTKQKKKDLDNNGDETAKTMGKNTEFYDLTAEDEFFKRRSSPRREAGKELQRAGKSKRRESSDGERTDEDRDAEQANKRKKEGNKITAELDRAMAEVKAQIKKVGSTAKTLKALVVANTSTKVEIKKAVSEADSQAEAALGRAIQDEKRGSRTEDHGKEYLRPGGRNRRDENQYGAKGFRHPDRGGRNTKTGAKAGGRKRKNQIYRGGNERGWER